jgi:RNA polymerase sigma-70 factor (ECF subfamily)
MSDNKNISSAPSCTSRFATTHWSVVLAAGSPESTRYKEALETLCRTYWFPLYAFLRQHGCDVHQAEDYIQAFFTRMLEKHSLNAVDVKSGKFRSFLLTSLKNFVANEIDHIQAQKRGGRHTILSLDFDNAERQYISEPSHQMSPEKIFEKSWAITVLEHTMNQLQAEFASSNKLSLFNHLRVYLTADENGIPYRNVAVELEMTEGAVKMAVHRLRARYRDLLRENVAQTVATQGQIDEEIHDLLAVLSS